MSPYTKMCVGWLVREAQGFAERPRVCASMVCAHGVRQMYTEYLKCQLRAVIIGYSDASWLPRFAFSAHNVFWAFHRNIEQPFSKHFAAHSPGDWISLEFTKRPLPIAGPFTKPLPRPSKCEIASAHVVVIVVVVVVVSVEVVVMLVLVLVDMDVVDVVDVVDGVDGVVVEVVEVVVGVVVGVVVVVVVGAVVVAVMLVVVVVAAVKVEAIVTVVIGKGSVLGTMSQ